MASQDIDQKPRGRAGLVWDLPFGMLAAATRSVVNEEIDSCYVVVPTIPETTSPDTVLRLMNNTIGPFQIVTSSTWTLVSNVLMPVEWLAVRFGWDVVKCYTANINILSRHLKRGEACRLLAKVFSTDRYDFNQQPSAWEDLVDLQRRIMARYHSMTEHSRAQPFNQQEEVGDIPVTSQNQPIQRRESDLHQENVSSIEQIRQVAKYSGWRHGFTPQIQSGFSNGNKRKDGESLAGRRLETRTPQHEIRRKTPISIPAAMLAALTNNGNNMSLMQELASVEGIQVQVIEEGDSFWDEYGLVGVAAMEHWDPVWEAIAQEIDDAMGLSRKPTDERRS